VPWVAPVVNAIRVLERMVPQGALLFDHHSHDLHRTRAGLVPSNGVPSAPGSKSS
jgi:hypothetical protein